MKYKKCPRCQLNYIREDWNICNVCQDEIDGKKSIFDTDDDTLICPYCNKHALEIDEIMCKHCQAKRHTKPDI